MSVSKMSKLNVKRTFLDKLRMIMQQTLYCADPLQAYVIPHDDSHMSEYLEDGDKRIEYASEFSGSAGTVVVTLTEALLWTDGRYHTQAEEELDLQTWKLMRAGVESTPTEVNWLITNLPNGSKIGMDPKLMTCVNWLEWEKELVSNGHTLVPVKENLVDVIWKDKITFIPKPIVSHSLEYSGMSCWGKIAIVKNKMAEKDVDVLIISALDEIAWLLNLRGSDVNYNPVFFSYMILAPEAVHLFTKTTEIPKDLNADHGVLPIIIHPYDEIFNFIENELGPRMKELKKIWIPNSMNYYIYSLIPEKKRHCECSPILLMKAIKNATEVEGMVEAHIKDGTALCRYLCWLEQEVPKGGVSERSAAHKLEEFRSDEDDYVGPSFPTISASGPNSAIIHYLPTEKTNRKLTTNEVYLCDSGAQFLHGTTDVTRTYHFGTPTPFEKEVFTRVFKGQTALAKAVFPNKLKGNYLDSFPRKALWEAGLDYPHGTSHGVGSYLHVHEGPMGISWRVYPDDPGLQANMILSNEPGYYQKNNFGVRLENIVQIVPAKTRYNHDNKTYLTFKTLTLVPIQLKMLDPTLLTQTEIDYLNNYHDTCREVIGQRLKKKGYKDAYDWLIKETLIMG